MKRLFLASIAMLCACVASASENQIPKNGSPENFLDIKSNGIGTSSLILEDGVLGYSGSGGNITLAKYAPSGKIQETATKEISLRFRAVEGNISLGVFFRSTEQDAYLVLINRVDEERGLMRIFRRAENSEEPYTNGVLASRSFKWGQSEEWQDLKITVEDASKDVLWIRCSLTDASGQLLTSLEESDAQSPLLQAGSVTLRFFASTAGPAVVEISEFSEN